MFMPRRCCTLEDMLRKEQKDHSKVADEVFRQMLLALDYLTSMRIIHRDVKPANILSNGFDLPVHLELADFGLSDIPRDSITKRIGTMSYMAPEMLACKGRQTDKMDIWSLFVTVLCFTADLELHNKIDSDATPDDILKYVAQFCRLPENEKVKHLGEHDPLKRPSAAEILSILYASDSTVYHVLHVNM